MAACHRPSPEDGGDHRPISAAHRPLAFATGSLALSSFGAAGGRSRPTSGRSGNPPSQKSTGQLPSPAASSRCRRPRSSSCVASSPYPPYGPPEHTLHRDAHHMRAVATRQPAPRRLGKVPRVHRRMDVSRCTTWNGATPDYGELRSSGEEGLWRKLEGRRNGGHWMELGPWNGQADPAGNGRGHWHRNRTGHLRTRELAAHATVEGHGDRPQEEPDCQHHRPGNHPPAHNEFTVGDGRRPVKAWARQLRLPFTTRRSSASS